MMRIFGPFFFLSALVVFQAQAQKARSAIMLDCDERDSIAKVVFFRPFKVLGAGLGFELRMGDSLLTRMRSRTVYIMDVPLGAKHVTSSAAHPEILNKNKHTLTVDLAPGKVYFVKCTAKPFSQGIVKPNYKLLFKLLKEDEVGSYLQKRFLRLYLQRKLYRDFCSGKGRA